MDGVRNTQEIKIKGFLSIITICDNKLTLSHILCVSEHWLRHQAILQIGIDVLEKPTASTFKVVKSWRELRSSERLVAIYEVTLQHVPEECKFNTYCCKNLKTYTLLFFFS